MRRFFLSVFIMIVVSAIPFQAGAVLKLDITRGTVSPMPIAIPYFITKHTDSSSIALSLDITNVIENDLKNSGLFKSIDRQAFIEDISDVNIIPDFPSWRKINAQALLTGSVSSDEGGKIHIEFRLWDILSGKQFVGKTYNADEDSWRRVAHIISDEIYTRLTGEDAYFDSRIVYISESGTWKNRKKRLAIMDQDGANNRYLTSGKTMVLTPRFDPNSQRIIYLAYYGNKPSVYLYNIETGKESLLGRFSGMSFAPRFSPDGKSAIMSISKNGNSEIYVMNLQTRIKKRLTNNFAIDTSPSFSPDGEKIAFNSDRGKTQQIYIMDKDGSNVKRISFSKGSYATPVWSPRGDLIAFTRMFRGKFYIGVMNPDGSGERLLTESYLDEGPTFSPNGRVIMFARRTRGSQIRAGVTRLYSVDVTGYNERLVKTPMEASDPAWSPLFK